MAIDDKTRTELEAAVFRRLVEHLRGRTDVQNIDLMNLAGFCRNCLSNWLEGRGRRQRRCDDQGREPRGRLRHALRDLEVDISGDGQSRAARGDEEDAIAGIDARSDPIEALASRAYERRGTCGTAAMSTRNSRRATA